MAKQLPDNKKENKKTEDSTLKPEPETLHTPDPQDNMKGPLSSLMHNTGENFDTDKTHKQAEKEKEENM